MGIRRKFSFLFFFLVFLPGLAAGQSRASSQHVEAELISEVSWIKPGTPFTVAVRLTMEPEWHTYWQNPGDTGLATKMDWRLPDGFTAGEIQWPYPERIEIGPLVNFGYEGEAILLTSITSADSLPIGSMIELGAHIAWLECKEICVPAEVDLSISLPVRNEEPVSDPSVTDIFSAARRRIPSTETFWQIKAYYGNDKIAISLIHPPESSVRPSEITFFPLDESVIELNGPQELQATLGGFMLFLRKSSLVDEMAKNLRGVLVSDASWTDNGTERALAIDVPLEPVSDGVTWGFNWGESAEQSGQTDADVIASEAKQSATSEIASGATRPRHDNHTPMTLWLAILFSFLGGILLNLMPCVLPVLAVKILGFVKQAGQDPVKTRNHGLIFAVGVIVSFLILAGALILLQLGGAQIGWGFQLQSPYFVAALAVLFFLLGLNLLGVIEVGNRLMNWGGSFEIPAGLWGTFFSGVLATVVATPCTAPFMGAALGYGLAQTPIVSFGIFTALGLGMAFPYVLLSWNTAFLKFVPKPGPWMVWLKKLMSIPMMLTVVWLLWVLSIQIGPGSARSDSNSRPRARIEWQAFSPELRDELVKQGKPVFIDFTAAWCLTCQVNEQLTFSSKEVQQKFRELGIVVLKADWTRRDEMITRALAEYGRNGVPLYVLYGRAGKPPVILPEILTPRILLDALDKIGPARGPAHTDE